MKDDGFPEFTVALLFLLNGQAEPAGLPDVCIPLIIITPCRFDSSRSIIGAPEYPLSKGQKYTKHFSSLIKALQLFLYDLGHLTLSSIYFLGIPFSDKSDIAKPGIHNAVFTLAFCILNTEGFMLTGEILNIFQSHPGWDITSQLTTSLLLRTLFSPLKKMLQMSYNVELLIFYPYQLKFQYNILPQNHKDRLSQ